MIWCGFTLLTLSFSILTQWRTIAGELMDSSNTESKKLFDTAVEACCWRLKYYEKDIGSSTANCSLLQSFLSVYLRNFQPLLWLNLSCCYILMFLEVLPNILELVLFPRMTLGVHMHCLAFHSSPAETDMIGKICHDSMLKHRNCCTMERVLCSNRGKVFVNVV